MVYGEQVPEKTGTGGLGCKVPGVFRACASNRCTTGKGIGKAGFLAWSASINRAKKFGVGWRCVVFAYIAARLGGNVGFREWRETTAFDWIAATKRGDKAGFPATAGMGRVATNQCWAI